MAKKFGKLMLFSALAGAAAAGTYYYLQNKRIQEFEEDDYMDDFDDDFYDYDIDADSDANSNTSTIKNRSYVSLDLDNAKEIIGEKVIETIDKTKEKIESLNVTELVNDKLDKAKEFISEITSVNAETEYTDVDMSNASVNQPENTDETAATEATATTYTTLNTATDVETSNESNSDSTTEEFFDDSNEDL